MTDLDKYGRTPQEVESAVLMGEIYARREQGESWQSIATWMKSL